VTKPPEPPRRSGLQERPSLVGSVFDTARPAAPLAKVDGPVPGQRPAVLPHRLGAPLPTRFQWFPRWRGALLWVLPTPLLWGAVMGLASWNFDKFLADGVGFALFITAAWLTQRGIRTDDAAPPTRFARLWRWPHRTLGGVLTVVGAAFTAYVAVGHGPALSLAFAAVAALGFHLAYGFEPLGRPRPFGGGDAQSRRVAAALAEAEGRLLDLERTAAALANPELKARLTRLSAQGRGILDQIADRPTDLYRARKFLNVYLEGVQQVAEGYARTHQRTDSRELEQNFRNVLITVERVFEEQRQRLLETDVLDLDIQIEVLKKQLEREGIA